MRCRPRRALLGFTLVELMIAIVVLGVLAAIALPSYMDNVRRSRRAEAFAALTAVQQAQERWRSSNAAYTTSLVDLGLGATTPSGYYAISVAAAPASAPLQTAYVVTAVGNAGTSQASDTKCRMLSIQQNGGNLTYAGCGTCGSFTYGATDECWAR